LETSAPERSGIIVRVVKAKEWLLEMQIPAVLQKRGRWCMVVSQVFLQEQVEERSIFGWDFAFFFCTDFIFKPNLATHGIVGPSSR